VKNRLSKVLAARGVASRRACEDLIFAGRIKVNGEIVRIPQTMVGDQDELLYDNLPVKGKEALHYFVLNKPRGFLCSAKGNANSKLVIDLFKSINARLFTVGRLDKDTEGLLIVTNDGHFANRVIHPSADIQKEYVVKADHDLTDAHLKAISQGTLVEGTFVKPIRVKKIRRGTLKITIGEGKKREVRLLLEAAGLKTLELKRVRIGGLQLGLLPTGSFRKLEKHELEQIFEGIPENDENE